MVKMPKAISQTEKQRSLENLNRDIHTIDDAQGMLIKVADIITRQKKARDRSKEASDCMNAAILVCMHAFHDLTIQRNNLCDIEHALKA